MTLRQSMLATTSLPLTLAVLLSWPQAARAAQTSNDSGTITTLGTDTFVLGAPSSPLPETFSVRVVDPGGNPVQGLTVEFFPDIEVCIEMDPHCSAPERVVYGHFADYAAELFAVTDADGVARTNVKFVGGYEPGSYAIAAFISLSTSAANAAFIKNGFDLWTRYSIRQDFPATPPLDGYMSGNWYNPEQAGQGFQLEFTNQGQAVAIWFTYTPDGSGQTWIFAQGPYDNTRHSLYLSAVLDTGAHFPPAFRSNDVQQTNWGSLIFNLTDCNHGTMSWFSELPGYGSGSMPIARLTSIAGTSCP